MADARAGESDVRGEEAVAASDEVGAVFDTAAIEAGVAADSESDTGSDASDAPDIDSSEDALGTAGVDGVDAPEDTSTTAVLPDTPDTPTVNPDETAALDYLHEEAPAETGGFCEQCGSPLEPGAVFCTECGLAVGMTVFPSSNDTAVLSAVNVDHQVENPAEQKPKGKKKLVIAIIVVVAAIAIGILAAWQLSAKEQPAGEAAEQEEQPKEEEKAKEPAAEESASDEAKVVTTVPSTDQPVGGYPYFENVTASSQLPGDSVTPSYGPGEARDGYAVTAWNEGSGGNGTGEWIELGSAGAQHVTGIVIVGGYQKSPEIYKKNCRPHDITISFDDGTKQVAHLKDEYGAAQSVIFTEPKTTRTMRITIDSVYGGDRFNDCCISEILELPLSGDGTESLDWLWNEPYTADASESSYYDDFGYDTLSDADLEHANGSEYILPLSDSSYYDKEYLDYYTDYDLFIARNEIYARYGREFNNQELMDWFTSTSWYYPVYSPEEFDAMPSPLNEYEKANVALIQEIEKERGSSYQ